MAFYYKLDLLHARTDDALTAMQTSFSIDRPDNILSVVNNVADTEAWVKTVSEIFFVGPAGQAVLDEAFTKQEHIDKVLADMDSPAWTPIEDASGNL